LKEGGTHTHIHTPFFEDMLLKIHLFIFCEDTPFHIDTHTHTHTHIYIYERTYIYIYVHIYIWYVHRIGGIGPVLRDFGR